VAFGAVPRIAVEGAIALDRVYTFATPGGLASVATTGRALGASAVSVAESLNGGTGDYCTSLSTCTIQFIHTVEGDLDRAGGACRTMNSVQQAAGVYTMVSDNLTGLSFDAGAGVASGSLTAAFAHDGQLR